MKRFLKNAAALAMFLAVSAPMMAEGLGGDWIGNLQVTPQVALKLVFHISEPGTDPVVTLDSPEQGAYGIPTEVSQLTDDTVSLAVPMINMTFDGTLKDGKIEGTFKQNGMTLPLMLESESPKVDGAQDQSLRFPASSKDLKIYKKKPTDITFG